MREPPIRTQRMPAPARDRIYLYLEPEVARRVRDYAAFKRIAPSAAARELVGLGLDALDRRERDRPVV